MSICYCYLFLFFTRPWFADSTAFSSLLQMGLCFSSPFFFFKGALSRKGGKWLFIGLPLTLLNYTGFFVLISPL
jgi:hypothetical protein